MRYFAFYCEFSLTSSQRSNWALKIYPFSLMCKAWGFIGQMQNAEDEILGFSLVLDPISLFSYLVLGLERRVSGYSSALQHWPTLRVTCALEIHFWARESRKVWRSMVLEGRVWVGGCFEGSTPLKSQVCLQCRGEGWRPGARLQLCLGVGQQLVSLSFVYIFNVQLTYG